MGNDLISKRAALLAFIEKGQNSKRYNWGDTWELNASEIREVLESLPSVQTKIKADILKLQTYKLFENDDELYISRNDILKLFE